MAKDSLWRVLIRNIVWILVFELIYQGFSYFIGYGATVTFSIIGLCVVVFRIIVLPILFSKMVFSSVDDQVSMVWKIVAFLICWLPLIVLAPIEMSLWNHVSGYYNAEMQPRVAGVGETYAVQQLMNWFSWFVTSIIVGSSFLYYNRKYKKKICH